MIEKRSENRVGTAALVAAALALVVAALGTAGVATANDGGPRATESAGAKKQIKKLKRQLSTVEERLAALEGKPGATVPTSLPPTGPAGGDLTGSYPSPQIGPQTVGPSEIVSNSVGSEQLTDTPITVGLLDASQVRAEGFLDGFQVRAEAGVIGDFGLFGPGGEVTVGSNGGVVMQEVTTQINPSPNSVRIYARDSGALTQLVARFADGNIDVLAAEAP